MSEYNIAHRRGGKAGDWKPGERDCIEQGLCNLLLEYNIQMSELEFENLMANVTGTRLPNSQ